MSLKPTIAVIRRSDNARCVINADDFDVKQYRREGEPEPVKPAKPEASQADDKTVGADDEAATPATSVPTVDVEPVQRKRGRPPKYPSFR